MIAFISLTNKGKQYTHNGSKISKPIIIDIIIGSVSGDIYSKLFVINFLRTIMFHIKLGQENTECFFYLGTLLYRSFFIGSSLMWYNHLLYGRPHWGAFYRVIV